MDFTYTCTDIFMCVCMQGNNILMWDIINVCVCVFARARVRAHVKVCARTCIYLHIYTSSSTAIIMCAYIDTHMLVCVYAPLYYIVPASRFRTSENRDLFANNISTSLYPLQCEVCLTRLIVPRAKFLLPFISRQMRSVRRRLDADWSTLDLLSDGTCPDKQRMSSVYSVLRIWSGSEQMHRPTIFRGYILTTSKDQQINQF